jgi:hypothetical protein
VIGDDGQEQEQAQAPARQAPPQNEHAVPQRPPSPRSPSMPVPARDGAERRPEYRP